MDRGAWQATVHRIAKSRTRLSDYLPTYLPTWISPPSQATPESALVHPSSGRSVKGKLASHTPHRKTTEHGSPVNTGTDLSSFSYSHSTSYSVANTEPIKTTANMRPFAELSRKELICLSVSDPAHHEWPDERAERKLQRPCQRNPTWRLPAACFS